MRAPALPAADAETRPSMRILVRADASSRIGTGHVMRCLTLAERLRSTGAEVEFACRAHEGNLLELVSRRRGFTAHALAPGRRDDRDPVFPAHRSWLGAAWEEDADQVTALLEDAARGGSPFDGVIVDHYALDSRWERRLRPQVAWLMAIDDLADRPHDCDLLLDQNLYEGAETRYLGLADPPTRLLLGPRYALLRGEFAAARAVLRRKHGPVRRVLIFFGGTDPGHDTEKALEALRLARWDGVTADVVIGAGHPDRERIRALCDARPGTRLHVDVDHMSDLMARADLALGAGGTTSWERCCLGLPCLALCVADNQAELLRVLDARGALRTLGRSHEVGAADLAEALRQAVADPAALERMSETGRTLVTGDGADQVAAVLVSLPRRTPRGKPEAIAGPTLRRAEPGDLLTYLAWANDPETRRNSYQSAPIDLATHMQWFRTRLRDPETYLYILESLGEPTGQIRFQCQGGVATLGFSTAPEHRGRGFGRTLLELGSRTLFSERPATLEIHGFVKKSNVPSVKSFEKAGFTLRAETDVDGAESLLFVLTHPRSLS